MNPDPGLDLDHRRLTGAQLVLGLVLALGGLLVTVDTTVAVVALPAMVRSLDSTLPALQWVTTGYLLGVVAVIPVAGWAANRFGARRVYLTGLLVFTMTSLLVGAAWDVGSVIAFRVAQGLGGGLLNPVGQAIALRAVDRSHRGAVMALLGLPVAIGPVLGPLLAGVLIDGASWRWVFWINIPLGLAALLFCHRLLPRQHDPRSSSPVVDWVGLALVSTGGAGLVLGFTLLGESGRITAPVLSVTTCGVLLLVGFVVRSLRISAPLLDLRLLRHRPLAVGLAVLAGYGAAYFGAATVLPLFVQGVRGDSALLAGTLTLPMAIGVGTTLQIATRLIDRHPPRRVILTGLTLSIAGATALLAATTSDAPYPLIAGAGLLLGIGSGATLMPTMTTAVRDLEDAATPRGTTLLALVQQLSGALGAALIATTLTLQLTTRIPGLASDGQDSTAALLALDAATRAALAPRLADAVGSSYTVTLALMASCLLIASLGLREPAVER